MRSEGLWETIRIELLAHSSVSVSPWALRVRLSVCLSPILTCGFDFELPYTNKRAEMLVHVAGLRLPLRNLLETQNARRQMGNQTPQHSIPDPLFSR